MKSRPVRRLLAPLAAALALLAPAFLASPAGAVDEFDLPAGIACPDFPVHGELTGARRVMRTFTDRNGDEVRTIVAGTGGDLVLTNTSTGESLALQSSGAVMRTTVNDDGTSTVVLTGHWVLILFPTDIPAGPSTTLHVGRVVYTDAAGVFTVQEVRGRTTDLCAMLAG